MNYFSVDEIRTFRGNIKILKLETPLESLPFKVGQIINLDHKPERVKAIEFQKSGEKIISLGVICVKN